MSNVLNILRPRVLTASRCLFKSNANEWWWSCYLLCKKGQIFLVLIFSVSSAKARVHVDSVLPKVDKLNTTVLLSEIHVKVQRHKHFCRQRMQKVWALLLSRVLSALLSVFDFTVCSNNNQSVAIECSFSPASQREQQHEKKKELFDFTGLRGSTCETSASLSHDWSEWAAGRDTAEKNREC